MHLQEAKKNSKNNLDFSQTYFKEICNNFQTTFKVFINPFQLIFRPLHPENFLNDNKFLISIKMIIYSEILYNYKNISEPTLSIAYLIQ